MLVTPTSEIVFKVLDHSSFLKDTLLGEKVVYLAQILKHYNGRCENLELNMDLLSISKTEGQMKSGELVAVFNGLKIDNGVSGNQSPQSTGKFRHHRHRHSIVLKFSF